MGPAGRRPTPFASPSRSASTSKVWTILRSRTSTSPRMAMALRSRLPITTRRRSSPTSRCRSSSTRPSSCAPAVDRPDWPLAWVRTQLGYEPRDPALFRAALTHRSAPGPNNERLEFLGDAVLNLIVAHHLFAAFPQASEGDLSRLRARVVSGEPLAQVAASLGLGEALQLGSGELKTGGFRRRSILADALEAIFGALYLDGGLAAAEAVIERLFGPRIAALPAPHELKDAKTRLQEHLQS